MERWVGAGCRTAVRMAFRLCARVTDGEQETFPGRLNIETTVSNQLKQGRSFTAVQARGAAHTGLPRRPWVWAPPPVGVGPGRTRRAASPAACCLSGRRLRDRRPVEPCGPPAAPVTRIITRRPSREAEGEEPEPFELAQVRLGGEGLGRAEDAGLLGPPAVGQPDGGRHGGHGARPPRSRPLACPARPPSAVIAWTVTVKSDPARVAASTCSLVNACSSSKVRAVSWASTARTATCRGMVTTSEEGRGAIMVRGPRGGGKGKTTLRGSTYPMRKAPSV